MDLGEAEAEQRSTQAELKAVRGEATTARTELKSARAELSSVQVGSACGPTGGGFVCEGVWLSVCVCASA